MASRNIFYPGYRLTIGVFSYTKRIFIWAWWHVPIISELRRLRQEDHQFDSNL
jgi:hypothetical protein